MPLGRVWAAATTLAAPALRAMLRRRVGRGKERLERLAEREGVDGTPRPPGRLLWLHAASVGESVSVLPLLASLNETPDLWVLMTTGTVTCAALLEARLPALGLDRVLHRFVPLDVPAWAARFLDHWRPDAAVFVESEIWPNLLAACRARGIPLMLVNGRLSAGSLRAWRRAPRFAAGLLRSFALIHPQSEADAGRFQALGARTMAPGNLKLAAAALPVDGAELARLRGLIGGGPVWVAASTHPGEEAIVVAAHRLLAPQHPGLVTIIAPRHPERGAGLAAAFGARRRGSGDDPGPGIWIADTLGELGLLYRLAPIAFVGRSLAVGGGQNPLEPARLGCAIAMGPLTESVEDSVRRLKAAEALTTVADAASLAGWVDGLLRDPVRRARMGDAAQAVATAEGALPAMLARTILGLMRPA